MTIEDPPNPCIMTHEQWRVHAVATSRTLLVSNADCGGLIAHRMVINATTVLMVITKSRHTIKYEVNAFLASSCLRDVFYNNKCIVLHQIAHSICFRAFQYRDCKSNL